jgi:hypothetical protein
MDGHYVSFSSNTKNIIAPKISDFCEYTQRICNGQAYLVCSEGPDKNRAFSKVAISLPHIFNFSDPIPVQLINDMDSRDRGSQLRGREAGMSQLGGLEAGRLEGF